MEENRKIQAVLERGRGRVTDLSLNHFVNPNAENKFCKLKNLRNESDIEQFFVLPLLKELGFDEDYIETKTTIREVKVGKGRTSKRYSPDYICHSDKKHLRPVLIVDAKSPQESAEEGVVDAQLYVSVLRRKLDEPKPVQYCIGTNGIRTIVKHYESDKPLYDLRFADFQDENSLYKSFKSDLSRSALAKALTLKREAFEFRKPEIADILGIFEACHNIIRRKDGILPEHAFYEFSKIMFIKLDQDKKLRADRELKELIKAEKPLPQDKVLFSVYWIRLNEHAEPNPINAILFRQLREQLELEIIKRKKKRIFEKDEQIDLKPETIREIVRLLEHLDLYGIDEDLNGRLFETFLSATMRGKELGQLFTPRTVVEFMTELAELKATLQHVDRVLDACCGTGGFLIEAMTVMSEKVKRNPTLSSLEKTNLIKKIREDHLFGIDFGKKPPVARIARINMYLHGDGGSRIYFADALGKQLRVDESLPPEVKDEREELRDLFVKKKLKFDVVLTNPPFSMYYRRAEADQRPILEQYELAYYTKKHNTRRFRGSLGSNVMFIERYYDLLKPHGKLLTVIDESVLNTDTDRFVRDFILDNFLVKAIISLPRGTFKRAGVNVKTSILYLVKKMDKDEEQPVTFYAQSENTGFDPANAKKLDPSQSDLRSILTKFREFQRTGKI